jgi:hypothetical protein
VSWKTVTGADGKPYLLLDGINVTVPSAVVTDESVPRGTAYVLAEPVGPSSPAWLQDMIDSTNAFALVPGDGPGAYTLDEVAKLRRGFGFGMRDGMRGPLWQAMDRQDPIQDGYDELVRDDGAVVRRWMPGDPDMRWLADPPVAQRNTPTPPSGRFQNLDWDEP